MSTERLTPTGSGGPDRGCSIMCSRTVLKVLSIIKSMHNNTLYQILVNGSLSTKLSASLGVKQGCCMGPILSNIFQNDMHDVFTNCDPIVFENLIVYHGPMACNLCSHPKNGYKDV